MHERGPSFLQMRPYSTGSLTVGKVLVRQPPRHSRGPQVIPDQAVCQLEVGRPPPSVACFGSSPPASELPLAYLSGSSEPKPTPTPLSETAPSPRAPHRPSSRRIRSRDARPLGRHLLAERRDAQHEAHRFGVAAGLLGHLAQFGDVGLVERQAVERLAGLVPIGYQASPSREVRRSAGPLSPPTQIGEYGFCPALWQRPFLGPCG